MADLSKMAVQSKPCKTCPFAGEKPISLSPGRMQECLENLIQKNEPLSSILETLKRKRNGIPLQDFTN